MATPIRVLGFAGSLRRGSYNRAALRAAVELMPEGGSLETFDLQSIPRATVGGSPGRGSSDSGNSYAAGCSVRIPIAAQRNDALGQRHELEDDRTE